MNLLYSEVPASSTLNLILDIYKMHTFGRPVLLCGTIVKHRDFNSKVTVSYLQIRYQNCHLSVTHLIYELCSLKRFCL